MYLTILSFGSLMGPPISGAINRATGGYSVVGIYAGQPSFYFFSVSVSPERNLVLTVSVVLYITFVLGSMIMVAVMLLALSRYLILRRWGGMV
jgi:hypothetical protein